MMKRALIFLALLLFPSAASALTQAGVPPAFSIPWGNSAGSAYIRSIPTPSQIGSQNCAASLTDGFPPLTFVPSVAGGCPPFGQDFNGILNQITQWSQWLAAGTPTPYNSAFQSAIGGYPKGATISDAVNVGCFYLSTVDSNGTNPTTGGSNWIQFCPGFSGSGSGTSGASNVNQQVVTTKPFTLQVGSSITYVAGGSNTGPLQINVNGAGLKNVFRRSQLGATMSVGGETHLNEIVTVQWDGTEWQCMSCRVVRVGEDVTMFLQQGASAPPGLAFEDGSCVSQTTYADLYSVAASQYGSGCSGGTFPLPDSRGRNLAGNDAQGVNGAASRLTSSSASACAGNTNGTGCGSQISQLITNNLPNFAISVISTISSIVVSTQNISLASGASPIVSVGASSSVTSTGTYTGTDAAFSNVAPTLIAYKLVQY